MKESIRIAILDMNNGKPNEGMRCIKMLVGEYLSNDNIIGNYDLFEVRNQNEIPNINNYDIFISSGGPGTPFPEGEVWEKNYQNFLENIYQHNLNYANKKYLFLICHSFQLACLHWNLGEVSIRNSTSFGVMPIHKTKNGENENLLYSLPEPFYGVDSRDYQVLKGNKNNFKKIGAKIVCREKKRPHLPYKRAIMAIRFSEEIFGTQFHPEADSEGMMRHFLKEDKKKNIIDNFSEKKYYEMIDHIDDEDKIMLTEKIILPKFLEHAGNMILQESTLAT